MDRKYQFITDETGYTGPRLKGQTRLEARNRFTEEDYHYNTKGIFEQGRQRRSSVNMERRHHVDPSIDRDPRFKPRSYDRQHDEMNSSQQKEERVPRFRQYLTKEQNAPTRPSTATTHQKPRPSSISQLISPQPDRKVEYNGVARDGYRKNKMSTVSLAKLIQGPRERDLEQVSTNKFREPYQGYESRPQTKQKTHTTYEEVKSNRLQHQPSQPTLRELSKRHTSPAPLSPQHSDSAYYTNDALEIAEKYGVDLRNVAAAPEEPISANDVKHYIESRKSIRANREYLAKQDPLYIDNELTYEEFASFFDAETISRLQQNADKDTSGTT
jgi:hypothetical protein